MTTSSGFRFVALPTLVALALAVLLVPSPRPDRDWYELAYADQPSTLAVLRKREALQRALTRVEDVTQRVEARERAQRAVAPATAGVTFDLDPRLTEGQRREIMEQVRSEVSASAPGAPRYRLVVIGYVDPRGEWGARYERAVVLPTDATQACTVVLRIPNALGGAFVRYATDRLLGTCAFYAAFGAPGAGVQQWLLDTNLRRAGFLQPPSALIGDTSRTVIERYNAIDRSEYEACRAGQAEGCAAVFSPTDAPNARLAGFGLRSRGGTRSLVETPELRIFYPTSLGSESAFVAGGLLAALADSVGAARFTEIWQSPLSPAEAFERQSGRPLTAWVRSHLATRMEPYHAGPAIPRLQALLAFGLALLSTGVAIALTPRVMS